MAGRVCNGPTGGQIDLGTDLLPVTALGQEPPDAEIMRSPPRGLRGRLLSTPLMLRSYLFLGVLQAAWRFRPADTGPGFRPADTGPGFRPADTRAGRTPGPTGGAAA